jgi:lipopolysaccharide biosynthesis glycosyltransferase
MSSQPSEIKIPIVISFTDTFLYPACVFLFSAASNATKSFRVVFAHDTDFLSKESLAVIKSLAEKLSIEFEVFEISSTTGLPSGGRLPSIVYARIVMADEYFEPFLWLDVDILPLKNWQDIFDEINPDELVYAVPESKRRDPADLPRELYEIGLRNKARQKVGNRYFNSGVIYLNADKWKQRGFSKEWRITAENYEENGFEFADQCVLNYTVAEYSRELPVEYNSHSYGNASNNVVKMLHFDGPVKPWHSRRNLLFNPKSDPVLATWKRVEMAFDSFLKTLEPRERWAIESARESLIAHSLLKESLIKIAPTLVGRASRVLDKIRR